MRQDNMHRGRAQLERKLIEGLATQNADEAALLQKVKWILDEVGELVVVMPESGKCTATKLASVLIPNLHSLHDQSGVQTAVHAALNHEIKSGSVGIRRLGESEVVRRQGIERETVLNEFAAPLDRDIAAAGERKSVGEGSEAINMIDFTPISELSAEGKRQLGLLPSTFDSLMDDPARLEAIIAASDVFEISGSGGGGIHSLAQGTVVFDSATNKMLPQCPFSGSTQVYPVSTTEFKCFDCEPDCAGFWVDMSLSDILG